MQGGYRPLEGDGGKEVMSDGAFLAEGPFLVPCCGELGLNELFNEGGGRGREVRDKREVRGIFGKFVS